MLMQSLGSEASYALNGRSENVVVEPIIVPELELRNVKMQVFLADVVECDDDATLENAPETLRSYWCEPRRQPLGFFVAVGFFAVFAHWR